MRWQIPEVHGYGVRVETMGNHLDELLQEGGGNDTGAAVDAQLHAGHLGVDFLDEVDDEVDQLVLEHLLGVRINA